MSTHIAITKTKYQVNKELVLECIRITREEYNTIMHDLGLTWALNHFGNDEDVVNKLTLNYKFWMWWINQWNIRETEFVHEYVEHICDDEEDWSRFLLNRWTSYHTIEKVLAVPSSEIMNQLFADVIGETIHQVQAEMQQNLKLKSK